MIESYNIVINGDIETLGLITYNITYNGTDYLKEGVLKTHLYIEEIHTLECYRFKLNGVNVHAEASGSNDVFYIYAFSYDSVEILEDGTNYDEEVLLEMYKQEDK